VAGNSATGDLHGHDRSRAFKEGDDEDAQHVEIGVLVIGKFDHVGSDGTDQSVAEQDAEESADQGSGNFLADFLRRAAERTHCDDDTQDSGDDPKAGEGVSHVAERSGGQSGLMMMNFEVEVEHLVEIEGIYAGDGHAQRIANKVADVVVPEDGWTRRKQRTLVWFLYVVLKGHESIFAGLVEQVVHHLQRIEVSLFRVLRAAEDAADSAGDLLENVKRIGDEDSTDGRAADGDQFGWLKEDADVSVLHEIAGGDAAEHHDNADNGEHELTRLAQFPGRELAEPTTTPRLGRAT